MKKKNVINLIRYYAENNDADSKEATEAASEAENDTKAAETENSEIIDLDSDESLNVKK